jgi:hypothetical protein
MSRHALISTGLIAAALAASAPAYAQSDGVFMKDVLTTLGVIDGDKPQLDYRERAPLVVPPKLDLPKPGNPQEVTARNPAWPNDPDVAARKKAIAEARKPVPNNMSNDGPISGRPTPAAELQRGRKVGAAQDVPGDIRPDNASRISPTELRRTAIMPEGDALIATGQEPERTDLTQPPSGYRVSVNGGKAIRGENEPRKMGNDYEREAADPRAFIRQQAEDR